MALLIDTHAHLMAPDFDSDRPEVLERAQAAGVAAILCVTESLAEGMSALQRLPKGGEPAVGLALGIHPDRVLTEPRAALLEELEGLAQLARRHRGEPVIALGEVGLDYWRAKEEEQREVQRELLAGFVALSLELDLPLSVHSRSAGRATIELLQAEGADKVVLHAFDGRAARARPGVDAGYRFSVPGSVLRSRQKQKLVRQLPLELLLLESDAPVLGADPDQRNEPGLLPLTCAALARLKGQLPEEIAARTSETARALFRGLLPATS